MVQNRSTAVMANRVEPPDAFDDFPTRPWATRALCEILGPEIRTQKVWEPSSNRGFMVRPLQEYFGEVIASDIIDYGAEADFDCSLHDFIFPGAAPQWAGGVDWIITNPPFRLGGEFVQQALNFAGSGVAVFVRTGFLESGDRYRDLYANNPPAEIHFFSGRVPCHRGRIVIDGSTATSYVWLIWRGAHRNVRPAADWISPDARVRLTRPNDYDHPAHRPSGQRPLPADRPYGLGLGLRY